MAMARYQFTVTDELGNIVPFAKVEVRRELPGSPLAALKSDRAGLNGMDNAFTTGSNGFAAFHVTGGAYQIRAFLGESEAPTWEAEPFRYVGIGLNSESDFDGVESEVRTYFVPVTQTSGTANHLVVTPDVPLINSGAESLFALRADAPSGFGGVTMDVVGITDGDPRQLRLPSGEQIPPGLWGTGDLVLFHFNPTSGLYFLDLPAEPSAFLEGQQTSGTANEIVVTPAGAPDLQSVFAFRADDPPDAGGVTMDVMGITDGDARPFVLPSGDPIPEDLWGSGDLVLFHYKPTTGYFILDLPVLSSSGTGSDPYTASNAANASARAAQIAAAQTAAGGVTGPIFATDNAVARYDVTAEQLQDSPVIISDAGVVTVKGAAPSLLLNNAAGTTNLASLLHDGGDLYLENTLNGAFYVKLNGDVRHRFGIGFFDINGSTSGRARLQAAAVASTPTITLPTTTDTLVGKATTDELTNKTLTAAVGKGTWTASGTWTLPAFTMGASIAGGGFSITGLASVGAPIHVGGSAANASAILQSTTGVGSGDKVFIKTGNNGSVENLRATQTGVGIHTAADPLSTFVVGGAGGANAGFEVAVSSSITVQAYNRNTTAYATLTLAGSQVRLSPGGSVQAVVAASGCLSVGSGAADGGAGNIVATGGVNPGSFTVAGLPAGVTGKTVWCSNCRGYDGAGTQEGAGAGTGALVSYNSAAWKIAGRNVTAVA